MEDLSQQADSISSGSVPSDVKTVDLEKSLFLLMEQQENQNDLDAGENSNFGSSRRDDQLDVSLDKINNFLSMEPTSSIKRKHEELEDQIEGNRSKSAKPSSVTPQCDQSFIFEKISLNEMIPDFLAYSTIAIAGDCKKVGKTSLTYEIISEVLLNNPVHNIVYIDVLNGYSAEKQATIFKRKCKEANVKFSNNSELDRIKVLRIANNKEFKTLMDGLDKAVKQIPLTCLLVIDTLTFYYQGTNSYRGFKRGGARRDYAKYYLKKFNEIAVQNDVTVLFTLPEHLIQQNNMQQLVNSQIRTSGISMILSKLGLNRFKLTINNLENAALMGNCYYLINDEGLKLLHKRK